MHSLCLKQDEAEKNTARHAQVLTSQLVSPIWITHIWVENDF